ncbi:MAG: glycosyltransferase [Prevotella sp.]|jgi:glycosyltransferase involved in cell wall biosynthesis|nr:glycosyltransferase [Prevotella sp.]
MCKFLTIIIPTYNMEKYLRKCLDSLVVSEEQLNSLEVLVVNDGSKDSSSAIGHEFENKYPQTFKVIDKDNGNYGSCINRGLKEATGKYVKVLDADDSFDNESLQSFLEGLSFCQADLVITDYDMVDENAQVVKSFRCPFNRNVETHLDDICTSQAFEGISMHALAYNRSVFDNLNYHQTEGISYTDQEWIFLPMTNVKTVEYFPLVLYKYLVGREGQTMNLSVINKSLSHYYKIMNRRMDDLKARHLKVSTSLNAYLTHKSMLLSTFIYRAVLLRKVGELEDLKLLDAKIAEVDQNLYNELDNVKTKGPIGYRYIRYFHKHYSYAPSLVVWVYRKLYGLLKSGSEKHITKREK